MSKGRKKPARPARKARRKSKAPAGGASPRSDVELLSRAEARAREEARIEELVARADSLARIGMADADIRRSLLLRLDASGRPVPYANDSAEVVTIIDLMRKMWMRQDADDQPFRRIRYQRIAENLLQTALASKKMTSAVQALRELLRFANARHDTDRRRIGLIKKIGPPPDDPTLRVSWAQRLMAEEMFELATNTSMDPILKSRLLADYGAKLGITYMKTLMESKADRLERTLGSGDDAPSEEADELTPSDGITWPATSRFGARGSGGGTVPGDGAGPPAPEDG